jgi:hypothetical protein
MKAGTLIRWQNFHDPQFGGKIKPRWLICLGNTNLSVSPKHHYLHSTTCEENRDGKRIFFQRNKYPKFSSDCYLYFDEPPYFLSELTIAKLHKDINELCPISNEDLIIIYNGILNYSHHYSSMYLMDIHDSLNMIGITGLKKPRSPLNIR